MNVLVVLLPPRARPGAAAAVGGDEVDYLLSSDGRSVSAAGRAAAGELPRADSVVAVVADGDIAWHRITLPRAPAARMRQALQGLLEEALLGEDGAAHFALPPQAAPGQPSWVAVTDHGWLTGWLTRLEQAGRPVNRVLPLSAPAASASGHFSAEGGADASSTPDLRLSYVDDQGPLLCRLGGTLARQRLPLGEPGTVAWTATPAAAAAAEAWLGQPVQVLGDAERALQALRSPWNLCQFDLQPKRRGALALRDGWRHFLSPAWRPARWGLLALAAVQLIGLNLMAQRQQRAIAAERQAMVALLKDTHPQVRAVLDAPLQMARETDALRAAAGQPGRADLETLLAAAAAAWPPGAGPIAGLRYESGRLTIDLTGWDPARRTQLRERLAEGRWQVDEVAAGQLSLAPATGSRR